MRDSAPRSGGVPMGCKRAVSGCNDGDLGGQGGQHRGGIPATYEDQKLAEQKQQMAKLAAMEQCQEQHSALLASFLIPHRHPLDMCSAICMCEPLEPVFGIPGLTPAHPRQDNPRPRAFLNPDLCTCNTAESTSVEQACYQKGGGPSLIRTMSGM